MTVLFDVFVRSYESNEPLTTLTITESETINDIHSKLLARVPTIKNRERVRIWVNNRALSGFGLDLTQTVKDLQISAGSTIFIEDSGIQISYRLVSLATSNMRASPKW